jgi:hypothetical protein
MAALIMLTLCIPFVAGVGTAAASGNGKPGSPPGQGECEHGNSGKPCRDDPQPEHGRDCEHHGNQGGVNEDHCGGVPAPEPPTTTVIPPPTTTTTTTVVTTTSAPPTPVTPLHTSPSSTTPKQEPKPEEPKEERAPTSTPPKATTAKTADAPKQPGTQATAEPKQDAKAAVAPAAEKSEAVPACLPPCALAAAPKTAGQLPFTGLPLWVYVLAGLGALVAGIGVRRLARARRLSAQ